MILYRPVGHKELELICDAALREFPGRHSDQPFFYPVLNVGYAREIAEGWNTKDDTYAGYITRFNLDNDYSQKYQRQTVGGTRHEELWVPADELSEFNSHLVGHIEVIAAYFDERFVGSSPSKFFTNKSANANEYLRMLLDTFEDNMMDFRGAVILNYKSVFCNYAYWKQEMLSDKDDSLQLLIPAIADAWHDNFLGIRLPTEAQILEHERKDLT